MDAAPKRTSKAMDLMPSLMRAADLTHTEQSLIAVMGYAFGMNWSDLSQPRTVSMSNVAKWSKMSSKTCARALRSAEAKGYLLVGGKQGYTLQVSIHIDAEGTPLLRTESPKVDDTDPGQRVSPTLDRESEGQDRESEGVGQRVRPYTDVTDFKGGGTDAGVRGQQPAPNALPPSAPNGENSGVNDGQTRRRGNVAQDRSAGIQAGPDEESKAASDERGIRATGRTRQDPRSATQRVRVRQEDERGPGEASRGRADEHQERCSKAAEGARPEHIAAVDAHSAEDLHVPVLNVRTRSDRATCVDVIRGESVPALRQRGLLKSRADAHGRAQADTESGWVARINAACAGPVGEPDAPEGWHALRQLLANTAGMQSVGIERDLRKWAQEGHALLDAKGLHTAAERIEVMADGYRACIESGSATPRALWILERGCKALTKRKAEAPKMRVLTVPVQVHHNTSARAFDFLEMAE